MTECERCGEAASEALPTGEPVCETCLTGYWDDVLDREGLGVEWDKPDKNGRGR